MGKLDAGSFGKQAVINFREPKEHQLDAINAAKNHFQNHSRGKLIMACGTGKTYTSLKIAETLAPNGKILFLVPSISLLGQISDRMKIFSGDKMTVIFSTYQSLERVAAAQIDFDLIICDEAHRTTDYGTEATAFTQVHDQDFIRGKKRIYMTATPRLYTSEAKKKAADNDLLLWSMDDKNTYGEEFNVGGKNDSSPIIVESSDKIPLQTLLNFEELKNLIYARMVEHVGNRRYWEQWAKDIAQIADRHIQHIKDLISVPGVHQREFGNFVFDLQKNLNPSITPAQAVEMLAHHMISRPVFDAVFENYSFVKNNPVSQSIEKILSVLDTQDTSDDSAQLEKFYQSVRERYAIATSAEDKQKIIIELYDKFFKMAVPKTVEKLGIVYTPVEVVDFILRSVDAVLKKNFNRSLSDKNVHVLDTFAGTGTFITRLIQSGLIHPKDLLRKYFRELHANEIVMLAYYITAVNIENAFHAVRSEEVGIRSYKGENLTPTSYLLPPTS